VDGGSIQTDEPGLSSVSREGGEETDRAAAFSLRRGARFLAGSGARAATDDSIDDSKLITLALLSISLFSLADLLTHRLI
jgi:hypothetical protein